MSPRVVAPHVAVVKVVLAELRMNHWPVGGRRMPISAFRSPSKSVVGCFVGGLTVRTAASLVADPPPLLTTHRYRRSFNPTAAPVTVSVGVVAPLYGGVFDTFVHDTPA